MNSRIEELTENELEQTTGGKGMHVVVAIKGTPALVATLAQSMLAVIYGTPAPATTRVVQMAPGPMPTLIPSTPALIRSRAAAAVAMLPAINCTARWRFFTLPTVSITLLV